MNIRLKKITDEVYYTSSNLCLLSKKDLKKLIFKTKKKKTTKISYLLS